MVFICFLLLTNRLNFEMAGIKRKHVSLTLSEKLDVLKRLDKGESLQKIAKELNVGRSTIKDWKKNRKNIEDFTATVEVNKTLQNRKSLKKSPLDSLDSALWIWFSQEREKGTNLTGPIIKKKAFHLHQKMCNTGQVFTASEGWLNRWKLRHGISCQQSSSDKLYADEDATKLFGAELNKVIEDHGLVPDQVYNIYETALYYKTLPATATTKVTNERLTIAPCSNATGTHKLPLLVIGKSKKPRAFKNIHFSSLPVYYRSQQAARLDSTLLKTWFFDEFVPAVKGHLNANNLPSHAILILGNEPLNFSVDKLVKDDIKAIFIPAIQHIDQGVIKSLKSRYRIRYLSAIITETGRGCSITEARKTITIKDAIYFLAESWEEMNPETLQKSFHKVWPEMSVDDKITTLEAIKPGIVEDLHKLDNIQVNDVEVSEWFQGIDSDAHQHLDDEEIITAVQKVDDSEESEDSDSDYDSPTRVSHSEAIKAFDVALKYVEQNPASTSADTMFMRKWKTIAEKSLESSAKHYLIYK